MSEPVQTNAPDGPGRPTIAESQYWAWLDDMKPFLEEGVSLNYAMSKVGILKHKDAIYEKYREGGEFSEKIDAMRAMVGELVNLVGSSKLKYLYNKLVATDGAYPLNTEELQMWKTLAEKHRTAQPFFVTRQETAEAKEEDFGRVVEPAQIIINAPAGAEIKPPEETNQNAQEESPQPTEATNQVQPDAQAVQGVADNPEQNS